MSTVSETTDLRQIADWLAKKTAAKLGQEPPPVDFTPPLSEFLDRRTETQLVVGGPRAGKTLLTSHYQRAILEQRGAGEPVPVRFP